MTNISRRGLLRTGAAAGVLAASGLPLRAQDAKRGGRLRMGLNGANTSDSWDSRTHSDIFMTSSAQGAVFDSLTQVSAEGSLVGELATDWEASSDAKTWTFNLRDGVTFHNGKPFNADDVIESLQLHVAEGSKSAAAPIVEGVEMKKTGDLQVQFTLPTGNADFPFLLSDYHLLIYPAGQIEEAIAKGIGTGLYRVQSFDPGVRFVGTRVDSHYKDGEAGWFDEIEIIAINDPSARMNALMTGQVDVINDIDFKTEPLMRQNPMIEVFEVTGNHQYTMPMLTDTAPFDDVNVRRAIKYGINREEMVQKILQGHGMVGNDHPIGPANQYYAEDLEQLAFDPDQAKYHLKQAGLDSINVELSAASTAFNGAIDAAQLAQASLGVAGINVSVIQEPADGYWSNVWLKKPWCLSYWSGRATEDWMFSSALEAGAPWNDTHWDNEQFQKWLIEARGELDSEKRAEIYRDMQKMLSEDGGYIVPMYANLTGAASTRLGHGEAIGNLFKADNNRLAERWWFTG
ncbi:peptide ABC transporter substrate-binding protein [Mesobaculum littorinae]|uniref:Peptide ABC transporter substrate-binding protein n=1 Tax=Mesobaculum littorinae TaxID=2486419 RepID=A0A438AHA3_9RHOB|nr:ABC transporter substrate-binding protein [Mesobaculum littorinae]RVV98103.1 peptide ABC transporter substrate-binding protein [Mesobaculum littorinae]